MYLGYINIHTTDNHTPNPITLNLTHSLSSTKVMSQHTVLKCCSSDLWGSVFKFSFILFGGKIARETLFSLKDYQLYVNSFKKVRKHVKRLKTCKFKHGIVLFISYIRILMLFLTSDIFLKKHKFGSKLSQKLNTNQHFLHNVSLFKLNHVFKSLLDISHKYVLSIYTYLQCKSAILSISTIKLDGLNTNCCLYVYNCRHASDLN